SDTDPKLVRARPRTLRQAALELKQAAGIDEDTAREALQQFLAIASRSEHERRGSGSTRPFFAFKLHQFLSGAGRAFATLEHVGPRLVALDAQEFAPGRLERTRLYAVAFWRNCGQEFHPVRMVEEEDGASFLARDIDEAEDREDEEEDEDK